MTKIVTSLLLICMYANVSFGQGYRGKRFMATYSPSYTMIEPPFGFTNFILYNSVKVGYVLSNHFVVNVNGQFGKTNERDFNRFETFSIKDVSGGISFLYFRKFHQNYAPVGRYMGLRFDYGKQNSVREIPDPEDIYNEQKLYYYDDQIRTKMMIISAEFGRNYVFKEKFLFGYGIQYGFVLGDTHEDAPKYRQLLKPHFNFGIIF